MSETTTPVTKQRTPSARVIAAMWLKQQIEEGLCPDALTECSGSRVTERKINKIREQMFKIAGKGTLVRIDRIVDGFKNPKPADPKMAERMKAMHAARKNKKKEEG